MFIVHNTERTKLFKLVINSNNLSLIVNKLYYTDIVFCLLQCHLIKNF